MSKIFDFLFWWSVEPPDDWPHLRLAILGLLALLLLVSSFLVVEDLRNPHAKHKKWLRPARPGRVIATYLAVGLIAGAVAALVLPGPAVAPTVAHYAGLVVVPIVVGVIASGISHLRSPASAYSPRLVFWEYSTLVAGLLVMRIAI